jgi:hypothetical protein
LQSSVILKSRGRIYPIPPKAGLDKSNPYKWVAQGPHTRGNFYVAETFRFPQIEMEDFPPVGGIHLWRKGRHSSNLPPLRARQDNSYFRSLLQLFHNQI